MSDDRRSSAMERFSAICLWCLWAFSVLPLFVLVIEFGGSDLKNCGNAAGYYAKFYSHFFLYPIAFGWISTAFLHRPFIEVVRHLCSFPERAKVLKLVLVGLSMALTIFFICYVEFTRPTFALWSFMPAVESPQEVDEAQGRARKLLEARCSLQTTTSGLGETTQSASKVSPLCRLVISLCPDREDRLCKFVLSSCQDLPEELNESQKEDYKRALETLEERGIKSWTEWAYYLGIIALTTLFAVLFVTIFISMEKASATEPSAPGEHGTSEEKARDPTNRRMLVQLVLALFFATFWMLMHITFLVEKLAVYPEDPLLPLNYLIFLALIVLYVHLVTKLWRDLGRYEKSFNIFLSVPGVAIGVLGFFPGSLPAEWVRDTLIGLFGTGGSLLTYIGVLLFLLVVYFPHILRWLDPDRKPQDSGQTY